MRDSPVQKRLLIHSALLKRKSKDSWGNKTEGSGDTILKFIRIQPSKQLISSKDNRQITLKSKMLFCCVNSRPAGICFKTGDFIVFNNQKYTIESVDTAYGTDPEKPHHYEIGLV